MGSSVAFTSEELYSGDNPAIIASAQPRTVSQNVYLSCVEKGV